MSFPCIFSSKDIKTNLSASIDDSRILIRPIEPIAHAADAGFYSLIPKAVVQAQGLDEIRSLFAFSQQHHIPMTFRTAGTNLSGHAISDGLLVDIARNWRGVSVEDGGRQVRVQPGVIGSRANYDARANGPRRVLRPVEDQNGEPASIKTLEGASGLLVEFQSADENSRPELEALAEDAIGGLKLFEPARFTHATSEQALLWKIRAGRFPSVGSVRKTGTTVRLFSNAESRED
jgi:hypothetical protein